MKSIRAKIMLAVSFIIIVALTVQGVAVSQFAKKNLSDDAQNAFKGSAESLLSELADMDRNIQKSGEMLMTGYDRDIRSVTQAGYSLIETYYERAQAEMNAIPAEAAPEERARLESEITEKYQAQCIEAIRPIRFADDGYLWIDNEEYVLQLLPPSPDGEGAYRGDLQDKTGAYIIKDLVEGAVKNGSFYYDYYFPKPGQDLASKKRGFVKHFEPWGWIIGTGNYVSEIEKEIEFKTYQERGTFQQKLELLDEEHFITITKADGNIVFADDPVMVNNTLDMVNLKTQKTIGEEIVNLDENFYEFVIEEQEGETLYIGYVIYDQFTDRKILYARRAGLVFGLIDHLIQAVVVVVGAMIVIGLILSFIVASSLTKPIVHMRKFTARVADGDLTTLLELDRKDELGALSHDLNIMVESLRSIVHESIEMSSLVYQTTENLAQMSTQTSEAIDQVAKAVEEIAHGSTEQVEETEKGVHGVGSLEESSDKIQSVTEDMQNAIQMMKEKNDMGVSSMHALSVKQKESFATIQDIDKVIKELAKQIMQITTFTDTITAIAEQTNLLALNASIEAARAGEHGRGFAVVADEIRKLAEESDSSAREIQELTSKISKDTKQVSVTVRSAEAIFEDQNVAVEASGNLFDELNESVETSSEKLSGVIDALGQLTTVKDQMVEIVMNIYKVAEQSASASEEVSASVEEQSASMEEINGMAQQLQEHAESLKETMKRFTL